MHLIRVSQEVTSQKACNELCPFKSGGRVLTKIELNFDTTAKELLAIYFCVKQNKVCLMKGKFIGHWDHEHLVNLKAFKNILYKQHQWIEYFQEMNININ